MLFGDISITRPSLVINHAESRGNGSSMGSSGGSSLSFSNFTCSDHHQYAPSFTVLANDSVNGILPGSVEFAFCNNANQPFEFTNVQNDPFSSSVLEPWWIKYNEASGSIVQSDGALHIHGIDSSDWGIVTGATISRNAPAVFQTTAGDFSARTQLNVTTISGQVQNGGIIIKWGSDFVKFFYRDFAIRMVYAAGEYFKPISYVSIATSTLVWLSFARHDDMFTFNYSVDGVNYIPFLDRIFPATNQVEIGIYASRGATIIADDWEITPSISCTGASGSMLQETISIQQVPFNDWAGSGKQLQVRMKISNGSACSSPIYNISTTAENEILSFTDFSTMPGDTPTGRTFTIDVASKALSDPVVGTESFTFQDRTWLASPDRDMYISPHVDSFTGTTLAPWWSTRNPGALQNNLRGGILSIADTANATLSPTIFTAPFISQGTCEHFDVIVDFSNWTAVTGHEEFGVALVVDNNLAWKLYADPSPGSVNVGFEAYGARNVTTASLPSLLIPVNSTTPVQFKIAHDLNTTTLSYKSPVQGDGFHLLGTIKNDRAVSYNIGIYVGGNGTVEVKKWSISPSISSRLSRDEPRVSIFIDDLEVPAMFMAEYALSFGMNSTNGSFARSNIYSVEHADPLWENKGLLLTYGINVMILDMHGNVVFAAPGTAQLDAECLANGDVVVSSGTIYDGAVTEYNAAGEIVRTVTAAGGKAFLFTHDTNVLPNGNWLITDTRNDRVIEIDPSGTIIWSWNVWDYFNAQDSREYGISHVNDAARLSNGNTLISIRNLDTVVEVTPSGYIIWSYGRLGTSGSLHEPHNPDRTVNDTTIICDSRSSRVLEVDFRGNTTWSFDPTTVNGRPLHWIRDADLLPGGEIIMADGQEQDNTDSWVILVDKDSGDAKWEFITPNPVYDVDIVDLGAPFVSIVSPGNQTFISSNLIPINLHLNQGTSKIVYRIHDDSANTYVDPTPRIYTGPEERLLQNNTTYTMFAWATTTQGTWTEGEIGHDYHGIPQQDATNCTFSIQLSASIASEPEIPYIVYGFDPVKSCIVILDKDGSRLGSINFATDLAPYMLDCHANDIEILPANKFIIALDYWLVNGTNCTGIREINGSGSTSWQYTLPLGNETRGISDVDYVAASDMFLVSSSCEREIYFLQRNCSKVVLWNTMNYIDQFSPGPDFTTRFLLGKTSPLAPNEFLCSIPSNDAIFLFNSSGHVNWILNATMNATSISQPQYVTKLANGSLLCINGSTGNVVMLDPAGGIAWSSLSRGSLASLNVSSLQVLPNMHFVLFDKQSARLLEVNMSGNIFVNVTIPFLIDEFEVLLDPLPLLVKDSTIPDVFHSNSIDITLHVRFPGAVNSTMWRLFCITNDSWAGSAQYAPFGEPGSLGVSFVLPDGDYSLDVLINATVNYAITNGSDMALFLKNIPASAFLVNFSVDVDAWFTMPAPWLVQGRLPKTDSIDAILSWKPTDRANNYTIYYYEKPIVSINGSVTVIATTMDPWFILTNAISRDGFFAVVATNDHHQSAISNSIHLVLTNTTSNMIDLVLMLIIVPAYIALTLAVIFRKVLPQLRSRRNTQ